MGKATHRHSFSGGLCSCGQRLSDLPADQEAAVGQGIEQALLHGLFPEPVLRRTLLKSVGAATVLGALSSTAAARHAQGDRAGEEAAGEDQAQCRLPADHLRHAADLRRASRPLRQGRARGQPAEDRRHQHHPRQDDQRRARRVAAGDAGRADHDGRSRRHHAIDQGAHDLQSERQFAGAREQAQGQPRSEEVERASPSPCRSSSATRRCSCATTSPRTGSIPTRT